MRHLGDLLVWMAMIATVLAVLYLTPQVARYFSDDARPAPGISRGDDLASLESGADSDPTD